MNACRLTSVMGATAGAIALALAPSIANAAGPFNHLEVGGVTPTTAGVAFNGAAKAPITANVPGLGTITCSAATASGKVYAADIRITALSLTCPPIISGSTVTIGISPSGKCANGIIWTPTPGQIVDRMASATNPPGYAGPYDTAVAGTANFGSFTAPQTACVLVTFKILGATVCTFKLAGNVGSTFNETPKGTKPAISQQLNLGGNLTVGEVTGSSIGWCSVSDGDIIGLSVALNLTVPGSTNPPLIDAVP